MNLLDLARTTSFRLALTFLLLFSAASVGLFAFVHWETKDFLSDKTDEWVGREIASLQRLDPAQLMTRLKQSELDPGTTERPFALYDPSARRLAGTPIDISPETLKLAVPSDFMATVNGKRRQFRGRVLALSGGNYLLVAQGLHEQGEFDERLFDATLLAALATAFLGLVGAIFLGAGSMRQIDNITRATERIVKGDLSQRLPVGKGSSDIDRLTHVVNGMLTEIERLMHEVKGVCDNIAHDMRTPLTRLLAGLERTRRRAEALTDYEEGIDDAIEEIRGILKTFSALLRISEVEDGIRRSGFVDTDLSVIAQDAVELFEPTAEERGIELRYVERLEGPATIAGDPDLLFEAVSNLIDNALKFTPAGGQIEVTVSRASTGLSISVDDTGPGIPEEEVEAVLRRFHRAERSRTTPGNGLGLSLVAAIARLHELDLVLGKTGAGCRVTMLHPASKPVRQT